MSTHHSHQMDHMTLVVVVAKELVANDFLQTDLAEGAGLLPFLEYEKRSAPRHAEAPGLVAKSTVTQFRDASDFLRTDERGIGLMFVGRHYCLLAKFTIIDLHLFWLSVVWKPERAKLYPNSFYRIGLSARWHYDGSLLI